MEQLVTAVGMVVQFIVSYLIAKNPATGDRLRKLIPVLTFPLAIITQVIASANAALPPEIGASAPVIYAGFFGTFGRGFLDTLWNALLQQLILTGAHSGTKNVIQGLNK